MIGINRDGDALVVGFYTKSRPKAVETGERVGLGAFSGLCQKKVGTLVDDIYVIKEIKGERTVTTVYLHAESSHLCKRG